MLTAAWGHPAVTWRCGVPEPTGFRVGVETIAVNDVQWYRHDAGDSSTWTAVDRGVYVEVDLPDAYQGVLLTELTPAIAAVLPAVTPSPRAVPTG